MAGVRFRTELHRSDGSMVAFNVDTPDLTADQRAAAQQVVDEMIAEAHQAGVADPEGVVAVLLTERAADEAAYRREAQRRGVLPL